MDVWPRPGYVRIEGDGYVRPAYRGQGIGRRLLREMEARSREMAERAEHGIKVRLRTIVFGKSAAARDLLESEGFTAEQFFWRMVIDLGEPQPAPEPPEGVTIREFRPREEREVHDVVQRAFADNYRNIASPFEEWRGFMMEGESFDPALWFVAEHQGRLVGVALCPDFEEYGWVRQLAVDRAWRGKGVGKALLRAAFAEFRRRGKATAALVVDSYNRTGARDFYEALGMSVEREHVAYEKVIRG
jgi:mycothiol synthase